MSTQHQHQPPPQEVIRIDDDSDDEREENDDCNNDNADDDQVVVVKVVPSVLTGNITTTTATTPSTLSSKAATAKTTAVAAPNPADHAAPSASKLPPTFSDKKTCPLINNPYKRKAQPFGLKEEELSLHAFPAVPSSKRSLFGTNECSGTVQIHQQQQQSKLETEFKQSAESAAAATESSAVSSFAEQSCSGVGGLSTKWHHYYAQTREGSYFRDPEFTPTESSLDGRTRRPGNNINNQRFDCLADGASSSSSTLRPSSIIYCHCGVPASARTVQSDGPNYGRFYLACGQLQRRRTAVVAVSGTTSTTSPSSSPQRRFCNFFQWDTDGSKGAAAACGYHQLSNHRRRRLISWHHFGLENNCCLYRRRERKSCTIAPDQVRQGAIGNCWFLSALAVVAERPYLIQHILPHQTLNAKGIYQINLCLDGAWTPIIVDSYLPVLMQPPEEEDDAMKSSKTNKRGSKKTPERQRRDGIVVRKNNQDKNNNSNQHKLSDGSVVVYPVFCATPDRQLWPALIEKAYAKAHGSYTHLSGGLIAEGLHDLTGAPTETIVFHRHHTVKHNDDHPTTGMMLEYQDDLWLKLLSFHEAGYCLGVATSQGGNGLVGGHAYSILDVLQIDDHIVGEQSKLTDYFNKKPASGTEAARRGEVDNKIDAAVPKKSTIRLVRIRNPWGKREWKGAWSVESDRWTKALRKRLGDESYARGDGTFFMAFEDVLERFHHLDVAKTREVSITVMLADAAYYDKSPIILTIDILSQDWTHASVSGVFKKNRDPIESSDFVFRLTPTCRTWAFLSLIQPKKRSNTLSTYWYCDTSMIILKRKVGSHEDFACEAVVVAGVKRIISCETFLDPMNEYICVVYSCLGAMQGGFAFRLTAYSANRISIVKCNRCNSFYQDAAVTHLLKQFLRCGHRLLYPVAANALLACIHGDGCVYFLALNGASNSFLSLKLVVEIKDGMLAVLGNPDTTHDVPPRSQSLLLVVSRNGQFSASSEMKFTYMSSIVSVNVSSGKHRSDCHRLRNSSLSLSGCQSINLAGDLLTSGICEHEVRVKGGDTLDTYMWIPQIGAA